MRDSSNNSSGKPFPRVTIVGAGISGICLGIQLKRAGIDSFQILEKSHEVGGTWFDNTYPGCGCDVPSILYSFSFAPKPDWSRKYTPQSEILEYLKDCVDRFNIRDHIRFGVEVKDATFDESSATWSVRTEQDDEPIESDIFVSAVGQLSRPKMPEIEGIDSFKGDVFHTARWQKGYSLEGRRFAVVGNGASAIQIVPKLAEKSKHVSVFQRSPNWIGQRHDYAYPGIAKLAFRWIPGAAKAVRCWTYLAHEWRINLYRRRGMLNQGFTFWLKYRMSRKLSPELQKKVIPGYPAGCKRVLLSNDYLESLGKENVDLISTPIKKIVPEGIETKDGVTPLDTIVMATGFDSNRFLYPMDVRGRDGADLATEWKVRPKTYLGMMAPRFPNFFMLYGPNTNLGHNSIIFMVECQVNFVMQCLKTMKKRGERTIEVNEPAVEAFDREMQGHLKQKVWNGYVTNWYTTREGHIVNNWCRSTASYWKQTRSLNFDALTFGGNGSSPGATANEATAEEDASASLASS